MRKDQARGLVYQGPFNHLAGLDNGPSHGTATAILQGQDPVGPIEIDDLEDLGGQVFQVVPEV